MNRTLLLVSCALIAFAANSIFCRYALGDNNIDPLSFTAIRLISGAAMLGLLLLLMSSKTGSEKPDPSKTGPKITVATINGKAIVNALYLLIYASTFSFAYITLDTATGALILFGTVQLCMMGLALSRGQRLTKQEWLGFIFACGGFLLLTVPYVTTPSLGGLLLMVIAGIGWALYTIKGKGSATPLNDTAKNFIIATIIAIPCSLLLFFLLDITLLLTTQGVLAAIASGAFASGLGYAIWYAALPLITTTQAATSQLLVPVIAAIGGLLLLQEPLSLLIVIAGVIMLGGIYLMVTKPLQQ